MAIIFQIDLRNPFCPRITHSLPVRVITRTFTRKYPYSNVITGTFLQFYAYYIKLEKKIYAKLRVIKELGNALRNSRVHYLYF